jgi:predicted MFS family arabinose efflux permease
LVLGIAGMLLLGGSLTRPAIIGSALLFGACFGTLASGAQIEITRRVPVAMYAVANGIFSSSWNAGMGIGGVAFGLIAAATGFGTMFEISSVFLAAAGLILLIDQRSMRPLQSGARVTVGAPGVTATEETGGAAARR